MSIAEAFGVAEASKIWGSIWRTGVSSTETDGEGTLGDGVDGRGVNVEAGVSGTKTSSAEGAGVARRVGGKRAGATSSWGTCSC